uniref:Efflux RND transporter permease subunit n=1 Tax=Roseihalotalea indica TaxID=2867963 RepID=A0AA49GTZ7_9BACT|nr:efflux RND transporter permease subunit [Tunicatimonas sp. TK19036]
MHHFIRFFLENRLVTALLLLLFIGWGLAVAPFGFEIAQGLTDPVPVDAIPDIGENQQIVFTEWRGRSPQDVEDQITYPLTTSLLGMPGVKTIRSSSAFGFSSIYIIFDEDIEFYWSRSRILEKLNALPAGTLPEGVQPALGPDATALGQIFWYTLEGQDSTGTTTGGWDLQELRSVQDFYVRYGLASAEGVAEVASVGGYVKEYQVDVDPNAMKTYNVSLPQVVESVRNSNLDVGARTIEINRAEYFVRGLGYVKNLEDLEEAVVRVEDNVPIRIKDIARVQFGPASRRGILDKSGAEVVGGVVVARYGANPREVITNVKAQIEEISSGLPTKTLEDGTVSQVTIVPFYDRTQLINETLGTLEEALTLEVLITIIVIVVMVVNLRASLLISALLPVAVLMCFIAMRYTGVVANIVSLSGIAIAIGTVVDVGIILSENILKHIERASPATSERKNYLKIVYDATVEVASAIVTAVATTIVSFLPVFSLQAAEGKLFTPLAFTKTFVLAASVIITLAILPTMAYWLFSFRPSRKKTQIIVNAGIIVLGIIALGISYAWAGMILLLFGLVNLGVTLAPDSLAWVKDLRSPINVAIVVIAVAWVLGIEWMPLGASVSSFLNVLFVVVLLVLILGSFLLVQSAYPFILRWCLNYKIVFLSFPTLMIILGLVIWQGFHGVFGFLTHGFDAVNVDIRTSEWYSYMTHQFPGIGEEFMPSLDEGAYLLMPTSMPHAGIEENRRTLQQLDMAVTAIPEVSLVVGKLGRAESSLDPAPISMYENVINYKSEYLTDASGQRLRFKTDEEGNFLIHEQDTLKAISREEAVYLDTDRLIPDEDGRYFRQWRDEIQSPSDIWDEIIVATRLPGVTSAPKLQPIETRLVMLQTGMRAPMGIKVKGPDLPTIEAFGLELERYLKEVPSVKGPSVFAERIVGKPYLEIDIDRNRIARYGLSIQDVQQYIEVAIGGIRLTTSVEGRERYPIRVRYARELRDDPEMIRQMLIPTPTGAQIPLGDIAELHYVQGPQMIKSEDTFLVGYVLLDKNEGYSEVEVVEAAQDYLNEKIGSGELKVPSGVSYRFSGSYENQIRAQQRLSVVIPLCLAVIFLILYLQFRSVSTALMVFTGIAVAFSGGFLLIWLYGQEGFLDFSIFGLYARDLFQVRTVYLSVAVWVGFIALFGIATDDGVLIATYLNQSLRKMRPENRQDVRKAVLRAGQKRVRPALMTTATTLLALLPVLTSTGRGSDIMIPMAIPIFGGMLIEIITLFVVPVLYSAWMEHKLRKKDLLNG